MRKKGGSAKKGKKAARPPKVRRNVRTALLVCAPLPGRHAVGQHVLASLASLWCPSAARADGRWAAEAGGKRLSREEPVFATAAAAATAASPPLLSALRPEWPLHVHLLVAEMGLSC